MEAVAERVDAGEHLRLIHRVINQMGLRGDEAEDAFSLSLETITVAARTYNPEKGVLASWLANNIRWEIQSWRRQQRIIKTEDIEELSIESPRQSLEYSAEFKEVLVNIKELLTPDERYVIIGTALGYTGVEIAEQLGYGKKKVHVLLLYARRKLKAARLSAKT